jgi:F-type H+/Na+-transporting ATPase subunit beta
MSNIVESQPLPAADNLSQEDRECSLVNHGTVVAVRGSVVDAYFADRLPQINTLLRLGANDEIAIEVSSQLDEHHIRALL